ncbi:MAG: hypothetical protein WCI67_19160 [Chloroflexales bacterium]
MLRSAAGTVGSWTASSPTGTLEIARSKPLLGSSTVSKPTPPCSVRSGWKWRRMRAVTGSRSTAVIAARARSSGGIAETKWPTPNVSGSSHQAGAGHDQAACYAKKRQ